MKTLCSSLIFILSLTGSLNAQLDQIAFGEACRNKDLLVEWDSLNVDYNGVKAGFMNVVISRSTRYKILTDEGTEPVSKLTLPQSFDPLYQPHSSAIRNPQRLFEEINISYLQFERSRDGEEIRLYPDLDRKEIRLVNDEGLFGSIYRYDYFLDSLATGDELTIRYRYHFPFYKNWFQLLSTRLFFHGDYPKQTMYVDWSHDKNLEVDTNFINISRPQISIEESQVHYRWTLKNLPGCLHEPGARAHAELPWFSFTPKPYELLYEHYNTFEQEFIPFWYLFGQLREDEIVAGLFDNEIGIKNKDHTCYQKLADRWTAMAPGDSSGLAKLRYFQRYVADSTRYDDDYNYFINQESYKKDKPGTELLGGQVSEHTKEVIYAGMLPKITKTFFTAYTADTRVGYISPEYFAPMYDNELLFAAILQNNLLAFVIPKSDTRNLYAEELPFYYENAPAILIYASDYAGYKRNFNEKLRITNTPGSTVKDNYRKINSMAKADPDKGIVEFSTRITLSGQYSTLTRDLYTKKPVDSTINPLYLEKIYDLGTGLNLIDQSFDHVDCYFPFNASMNAVYRVSCLITRENDSFTLDLKDWIKHVYIPGLKAEYRQLNFYPDFPGSDSWAYMISFPDAIEILEMPGPIEIDNEYGTYKFSVKPMGDRQILVNSYFQVKTVFVDKKEIQNVTSIFDQIGQTDTSRIKFKTVTVK